MALIVCPKCGKSISDKAFTCTQCGYELTAEDKIGKTDSPPVICEDCGEIIPNEATICPNCGCPVASNKPTSDEKVIPQQVELTKISIPLFKKKSFWISFIVVVAIVGILVFGLKAYQNKQAEKYAQTYYTNLQLASSTMLTGASEAESVGNLIHDVWYNAIYDKYDITTNIYTRGASDFNDALANLFADDSFKSRIESIEANQIKVNSLMKELKNPPEQYAEAYDEINEYYDSYTEFVNLVISPNGSLQSFSNNFNDLDSKTANAYKKINLYFD